MLWSVPFVHICLLIEQPWLTSSAQNPAAFESIQNLEASKLLQMKEDDDQPMFAAPIFVEHMNNVSCNGGETAHFQCKVEPKDDPSLEISKLSQSGFSLFRIIFPGTLSL